MLAHALLAVITALDRQHRRTTGGLITMTCNEVRRLLTTALTLVVDTTRALA